LKGTHVGDRFYTMLEQQRYGIPLCIDLASIYRVGPKTGLFFLKVCKSQKIPILVIRVIRLDMLNLDSTGMYTILAFIVNFKRNACKK